MINKLKILLKGGVIGQLFIILGMPIISRIYSPSDFGIHSLIFGITAYLVAISGLRFETACTIPRSTRRAFGLLTISIFFVFLTSALALAITPFAFSYANCTSCTANIELLIPLGIFILGLGQSLTNWGLRTNLIDVIARAKIYQGLSTPVYQGALSIVFAGPFGLILGQILSQTFGIYTILQRSTTTLKHHLIKTKPKYIAKIFVRYLKFSYLSTVSTSLLLATPLLPAILINKYSGPEQAGWFFLAAQTISLPLAVAKRALSQAIMSESVSLRSEYFLSNPSKKIIFIVTTAISTLLILFFYSADHIYTIIFGSNWHQSALLAKYLIIMFLLDLVVYPLSHLLIILEKHKIQLAFDAGRIVVVIGGMWALLAHQYDYSTSVLWYSASMSLIYILLGLTSILIYKNNFAKTNNHKLGHPQ